MTRAALLAACAVCAFGSIVAPALGDADPPSDYLVLQDAYYPYNPKVSAGLQANLDELTARSRKAGFPIKVAIIGSPSDLGAVPQFWGHPDRYVKFLHTEIRNGPARQPLLAVMPVGYGGVDMGPKGDKVLASLPRPVAGADGEASAAISAVKELAAANGVQLDTAALPKTRKGRQSGGSLLIFLAPLAVLALGAGVFAVVSRRRRRAG
jgi:hypothetical protein